jgi:hypothetical protein
MKHSNEPIDEEKDGVVDLPILLDQQPITDLALREDMQMLESIQHAHLRRLVRVLLGENQLHLVGGALKRGTAAALENADPGGEVPIGRVDCVDAGVYLLVVVVPKRSLHFLQLVLQTSLHNSTKFNIISQDAATTVKKEDS